MAGIFGGVSHLIGRVASDVPLYASAGITAAGVGAVLVAGLYGRNGSK